MSRKCITIDRQFGSGGREVGKMLAKRLDIPFYDNELLMIAAEKYGINPGIMREHDEKRNGSLLYNIAIMTNGQYDKVNQPYKIFQAECDTIRRLADDGPCIFIGRCSDYALKDKCKTLNIFIYASAMADRINRAGNVDKIEKKNIERFIKQKDMQRKSYYNSFTEKEWGDMTNYDLCLNTSTLGYEKCVDIIEKIYRG